MTFLINIFFWLLSGLLKYQSSTEQNPPLVHLYSPVLIVVLTIRSRMVLFIMENPNVNVKNVVTEPLH
jgi:surface polysaccharide O-acyltransferase-like enzyme